MTIRGSYPSLHGRKAGISEDGELVATGGLVSGGNDKPAIRYLSSQFVAVEDDFLGDTGSQQWVRNAGTDTGAHIVQGRLTGVTNGVFRMLSGTGYASFAETIASINRGVRFKANQGDVRMYARVKIPTITSVSAFIGFTDDTGTAEPPIWEDTGSGAAVSTASNAAGFLFDTANSHTAWQAVGVAADVDATPVDLESGPTANVYEDLEVVLDTGGNATFYRNGAYVGKLTDAVTPTTGLVPVFSVWPHSVAARSLDVDAFAVSARRDTGT